MAKKKRKVEIEPRKVLKKEALVALWAWCDEADASGLMDVLKGCKDAAWRYNIDNKLTGKRAVTPNHIKGWCNNRKKSVPGSRSRRAAAAARAKAAEPQKELPFEEQPLLGTVSDEVELDRMRAMLRGEELPEAPACRCKAVASVLYEFLVKVKLTPSVWQQRWFRMLADVIDR